MTQLQRVFNKRSDRKGSIVVMSAVFMIVVIAFLAFSIDFGYMVVTQAELQNAADSAAISGIRALEDGRESAISAAKVWANKNRAAGDSVVVTDADVELGYWDDDRATFTVIPASSPRSPNAVRVYCRRTAARGNPLSLFFAPALGNDHADLTAFATARIKRSRCSLIIGLDKVTLSGSAQTDSYRSSDGVYNPSVAGNRGDVCSNGDVIMSGSSRIHGNCHPGPGKVVKRAGSGSITGETSPLSEMIHFPPADPGDASTNNDNHRIPLSQSKKPVLSASNELSLSSGDVLDLPPGTYYFSSIRATGGASIVVSGHTVIYVTGNVDLGGSNITNSTQLPKNLEINLLGSKTTCVLSGNAAFHGSIYAPLSKVDIGSSSGYFGAVVAKELAVSGSGGVHADLSIHDFAPDGAFHRAMLVQ